MLSKLTSASAPIATLAAIFSIFANRIMLLFVSFRPKMCPQLLQGSTLSLLMAADPRDGLLLLLRRIAIEAPNSNLHLQWLRAALICRNYEFLDNSWENSVTHQFRQMKSFCLKFG